MSSNSLSWQQAVVDVLRSSGTKMHYKDIAHQILVRKLRAPIANAPGATNSALQTLASVHKNRNDSVTAILSERGYYALTPIANQINQENLRREEEEKNSDTVRIGAFGLYWKRDAVNWRTDNKLMGKISEDSPIDVDFADQDGVYFLQDGREIMYVGKTHTPNANYGLFNRLKDHDGDPRKTVYWDSFSWFGFKSVKEDGSLWPPSNNANLGSVINVIESIFIEVLLPRLNQQSGDGMQQAREDRLYIQSTRSLRHL